MTDRRDFSGIGDFIKDEVPLTTAKESPIKKNASPRRDLDLSRDHNADLSSIMHDNEKPKRRTTFADEKEGSKKGGSLFPRSGNLAYGSKKRQNVIDEEKYMVVDRCHDLEKENLVLKEKENLLGREVRKMQTKLRRIDELIRSGRTFSDNDYARLQQDLEDQFGEIKDENSVLSERVRKLKIIYKGLSSKQTTTTKTTKTTTKHFGVTHATSFKKGAATSTMAGAAAKRPQSTTKVHPYIPGKPQPQHVQLVEELKLQLVKNQKEILKLQDEKNRYTSRSSGQITTDELLRKIRERESEIRDINHQFEEIEQSFIKKESIFKDSKTYMEQILKEIGEAKINNQTLMMKNNKVQILASQTKSLNDQVKDLQIERDQLEASIRRITSEPFFNREKGQSTMKRIAELEEKLIEKDKHLKTLKEEEAKKQQELDALKPNVEKLRGEKEYLENENKKLKEKFSTNNNIDEFNVYSTLFKLDPKKYAETMKDFSGNPDSYPIWSNMDFLERAQEQIDPNNIKQLKVEIMKLRHENKDFAAELEKAQNLLLLQKDIEKDNSKYYDSEQQRLMLMQKSATMKAEELARRADEKQRQLNEISRKMGLSQSRSPSPVKNNTGTFGDPIRKSIGDMYETQSEFSVMTNESEIRTDENVMDFVVQDAEYYFDSFKQVLDERELLLHQKTLITFVTVDFYNHDTETSQIAEGFRPLYNTQFSFKNKVDDFYVQFMQKNTMKIDVYISKNNAAIHLGHAEVFLREIVERENVMQELSFKTPVIQKTIRIFAAKGNGDQPIGSLKFKMRMRKPISEAIRFYREKNEIANMTAAHDTFIEGGVDARNRKKLITVQIVGCKDIKVKYSGISNIAPFFYYQFYNFDERYSATGAGDNPIFEDTQNYEVQFDAKLINYLQKEPLEIILFDDNAPVTGVERGGKALDEADQVDDMIGSVKIPLADLIKGASIHDRFAIRNLKRESVGMLEAKISILDIDGGMASLASRQMNQQMATLHYNKQWENELIYRIAKKLARFPGSIELLFGIFSRGQKTVTKEDFKYTCLRRLQLKSEISEREIDMFLRGCPQLLDKEIIDIEDFLHIFSASISQARHDFQDEEAMQYQTIKRFEDTQRYNTSHYQSQRSIGGISNSGALVGQIEEPYSKQTSGGFRDTLNQSRTSVNFQEQEIIEILSKMRQVNITQLKEKIRRFSQNLYILSSDMLVVLTIDGGLGDYEARKVIKFFEMKEKISIQKFEDYLDQSLNQHSVTSPNLQRFINLIQGERSEALVNKFISLDYNKDGQLNVDGVKAALLSMEFGFKPDQAIEIFQIVQRDNLFHYRDFVLDINPTLRSLFMSRSNTPALLRTETPNTSSRQNLVVNHQTSVNLGESIQDSIQMSQQLYEDPNISKQLVAFTFIGIIKNKLKNYIQQQDITLSALFKVIDTNSNQRLDLGEFLQKMKALQVPLDDQELQTLFHRLDKTGKGEITYQQFISEFPEINIQYMVQRIRNIIMGAKITIEAVFNEFCSDRVNRKMSVSDFGNFVEKYVDKATDFETSTLFRHFTQDRKHFLTVEDFVEAFGREAKEQNFEIGIEDIIKPLATKIRAFGINISQLFDKYDLNKNGRLSAEELSKAFKNDFNLSLQDDEVLKIKEYFRNKHKTAEISKLDFMDLLNIKFQRKFDPEEAKKSLQVLKQKLQTLNKTTLQILQPYDMEKTRNLTLRNFKVGIHSLKCLNQYQIDNLAKYLDKGDDGFITIDELDIAIRGQHVPASNSQSLSQTGRRTEKWARK